MVKQMSKVLKLKKEQENLKRWNKYGSWFLTANALISIPFMVALVFAQVLPTLAMVLAIYLGVSITSCVINESIMKNKIYKRIGEIDQEILKITKQDLEELKILIEHDRLIDMEKNLKKEQEKISVQKRIIKEMIKNKNEKANAQQNYIKELTKKYEKQAMENKATARERAIKDVENLNDCDFLINQ